MALSPVPRSDLSPAALPGGAMMRLRGLSDGFERLTHQPAVRRALPSIVLVFATAVAVLAWMILRDPPRSSLYPGLPEAEKASRGRGPERIGQFRQPLTARSGELIGADR